MTTAIKRRRGTTTQHSTFTGLEGEITIDTTKDTAVVHDGATAGGRPLLREDLANNSEVVTKTGTQTLTNKTLTSPVINTPTGITKGDISLGNVDNTSDATKNSATATLTNKTITLGANTISGTVAQFQAAVTDGDFATLAGTETFTNKALNGTLGATTPSTVAATTISASGVSTFSAGSAGAPAITNSGDTNTGIFFPAADTIAFAEGGVEAMRIDSSGRLGIGISNPQNILDIASTGATIRIADGVSNNAALNLAISGSSYAEVQAYNLGVGYSMPLILQRQGGNVGIGTSATYQQLMMKRNTSIGWVNAAGNGSDQIIYADGSSTLQFYTAATERMRLDSSGNLGLGVTPSAWGGSWKAVDVSGGGAFAGAFNSAYMLGNAYYNASNGVYKATGPAGHYGIEAGTHVWKTAPSGTAGNAITFTQRMTLDVSGNLLVGTTAVNGAGGTTISGTNGGQPYILFNSTQTTNEPLTFRYNGTTVGKVTQTTSATSYVTSSDYRLKEDVTQMVNALEKVALLKPVTYKWKIDGSDGQGFIAHELQEVVPDCVIGEKDATEEQEYEITPAIPAVLDEEGNVVTEEVPAVMGTRTVPVYQGIDTSFLVATLTAAIQEQQAMIDELKAKVAALEAA